MAKALDRAGTARSFEELRLPAPGALALVVPAVEAATAVGMVAAPALTAGPVLALFLGFSFVIVRAVVAGTGATCACFGRAASSRPVAGVDLVRNAGLAAMAVVASAAGPGSALWPRPLAALTVVVATAAGGAVLAVLGGRRVSGRG